MFLYINIRMLSDSSHRRLNPLTGEWILVSPHRTSRPWLGQVESSTVVELPSYDPSCYLCPGNERANGGRNPNYSSTYVFDNDFAALQPEIPIDTKTQPASAKSREGLLVAHPERGICRVGCFSPRHDLTLAGMTIEEICHVVEMWIEQFKQLGLIDFLRYLQIFENRGAMMGASNPHPHCQIWATESIPNEPAKEQRSMRSYLERRNSCMLCDYEKYESSEERLIWQDEHFSVVVPFWAIWPFETLVISRTHVADISQLGPNSRRNLASTLRLLTRCYDQVFQTPFPYSMGFHQQPVDGEPHPEWHLHAHFYPPLLRSATVRKFMVGFEMLGTPQRDITAESAAKRLRDISKSIT
jgi:UDPglucose--hexose-1-phosphate uridylyltransferase